MIVSQELTIFEQSFAADVQAGLNRVGQKELLGSAGAAKSGGPIGSDAPAHPV